MKIIILDEFFRQIINCIPKGKITRVYSARLFKIFIFTPSIVNQLTMYINTNQSITTKLN